MKLFSSTQMSWSEPIFFVPRLRKPKGWILRGVAVLGIAAIMYGAIALQQNRQMGLLESILISLAAGAVLVAMPDIGNFQREVTISEDSISYVGAMGWTVTMGSFKLEKIQGVALMRPEDWGRPYGAMMLSLGDGDGFLLGVPNKVDLATVANVLHRLEVAVALEGWEPSETDTRIQVKDELQLPEDGAGTTKDARIWAVEEDDGRLTPPLAMGIAIVLAFLPLLTAFIGAIVVAVYLFMRWGGLTILERSLFIGGAVGGIITGFLYLLWIGQFLASRYMIRVGKGILSTRPGTLVNAADEDLICVEIYDRMAWTSTVAKSVDFGFLQIDGGRRMFRFEGDKNRWEIPVTALKTCRIEEAQVGSEGNENAEKRYYVVIAVDRDGEPWEAGMVESRTEFGSDGSQQRYTRAQGLFGRISGLVG